MAGTPASAGPHCPKSRAGPGGSSAPTRNRETTKAGARLTRPPRSARSSRGGHRGRRSRRCARHGWLHQRGRPTCHQRPRDGRVSITFGLVEVARQWGCGRKFAVDERIFDVTPRPEAVSSAEPIRGGPPVAGTPASAGPHCPVNRARPGGSSAPTRNRETTKARARLTRPPALCSQFKGWAPRPEVPSVRWSWLAPPARPAHLSPTTAGTRVSITFGLFEAARRRGCGTKFALDGESRTSPPSRGRSVDRTGQERPASSRRQPVLTATRAARGQAGQARPPAISRPRAPGAPHAHVPPRSTRDRPAWRMLDRAPKDTPGPTGTSQSRRPALIRTLTTSEASTPSRRPMRWLA